MLEEKYKHLVTKESEIPFSFQFPQKISFNFVLNYPRFKSDTGDVIS